MSGPKPEQDREARLEALFRDLGFDRCRWIDPRRIEVAQWVRMKCTFGCPSFGKSGCCPPHLPGVEECRRFFQEYDTAAVFHFPVRCKTKAESQAWSRKTGLELVELERRVFLSGYEKAFVLTQGCSLCQDCETDRSGCKRPESARPSPEAMAVDVYTTVRRLGLPIQVKTDPLQTMDRYSFLMVE